MAYEAEKDKLVSSKVLEFENGRIDVEIRSYDEGEKKLQLTRYRKDDNGEFKFTKLGRLTKQEVERVMEAMQELKGDL